MGHKHTREEILAGAMATAFDGGLSQLTYGRVAKRLGISDRIVVSYFPTKDDLIGDVLMSMGVQLQQTLAPAFTAPAAAHIALARSAWPARRRSSGSSAKLRVRSSILLSGSENVLVSGLCHSAMTGLTCALRTSCNDRTVPPMWATQFMMDIVAWAKTPAHANPCPSPLVHIAY